MRHPKIGVMLGYMIPVIPSSMVNFAADAMKLPLQQIVMSIVIGVIPSSVLYACGGEALFHGYNKTTSHVGCKCYCVSRVSCLHL